MNTHGASIANIKRNETASLYIKKLILGYTSNLSQGHVWNIRFVTDIICSTYDSSSYKLDAATMPGKKKLLVDLLNLDGYPDF